MNKFAVLLTTTILFGFSGAYAEDPSENLVAKQNQEQHVPIGDRAAPFQERVAIQEYRAQKAAEEETSPSKLQEILPTGQETFKASVSVDFTKKKDVTFGAQAWVDFYTTHMGAFHNAVSISFLGDSVSLLDGSIWNVCANDRYKVLYWLTTDLLVIVPNDAWLSSYMFKMVNQNTGDTVEVNMALGPIAYGLFTYWITSIDSVLGYVWLNDGSYWRTSAFDTSITGKWLPGDTVVIGVNNGFLHLTNPNILINVNTLTYATGECLH